LTDRQPCGVSDAETTPRPTVSGAKLKKILAWHTPPPLPDGAAEKFAAILREAEARSFER
jgi:hypothetical protein